MRRAITGVTAAIMLTFAVGLTGAALTSTTKKRHVTFTFLGAAVSSNENMATTVALVGATSAASFNRKIASEVPAAVKRTGTLRVATNGEPDSDLALALANLMGLRVKFASPPFVRVLPGVTAHKYDLGMSSIADTRAREKVVDFVTYFMSGISFYVKTSGGPTITTLSGLCGHKVGVPAGTIEESVATAQNSKCVAAGKPAVMVVSFANEGAATSALLRGDVDVAMADTPIATVWVDRSNGQLMLAGQPFDVQPYGIAVAKHSGLSKPVLDGLKVLISNGQYKAILTKWGLRSGAIRHPKVNGAIS
jgi:polar amino acid transport system substrate-binding protein